MYCWIYYSQSGRSVPCTFEDDLKKGFHDWIMIQILLNCSPPFYSNIASAGWITIEVRSPGSRNECFHAKTTKSDEDAVLNVENIGGKLLLL